MKSLIGGPSSMLNIITKSMIFWGDVELMDTLIPFVM